MKFTTDKATLAAGIQQVMRVIPPTSSIPSVLRMKMEVKGGKLYLSGTDLARSMVYEIDKIEKATDGAFCLSAKKLSVTISELENEAEITVSETKAGATIKCKKDKFTIRGADSSNFPKIQQLENADEFEVSASILRNMIDRVSFATASEAARFAFDGVLWEIKKDQFNLVGCNKHRLAIARLLKPTGHDIKGPVLVPRKSATTLASYLTSVEGTVQIAVDDKRIRIQGPNWTYVMYRMEGLYPPYERVLPDPLQFTSKLEVNREEYQRALRKASHFVDQESNAVRMVIKDKALTITAFNPEEGEAEVHLDVDFDGEEVEMPFFATYWAEVVKVLEEENITIQFKGNELALVEEKVQDDFEYEYLIMGVAE